MKKSIVNNIIDFWPNIPAAKRLLSAVRIRMVKSHYLSRDEVVGAELSSTVKQETVERYRKKKSAELASTVKVMEYVLANAPVYQDRKDLKNVITDMVFCRMAYGFQPDEYLCFGLENQSMEERRQWISDLDRYIYIHALNDIKDAQIFNNKARTFEMFSKYYGRQIISIKEEHDFIRFESFIASHNEFVKKKVSEGMGRSIELIRTESISPRQYFESLITEGEHVIEERIIQSPVMKVFNESSVNTIRCITFCTQNGIEVPYTFLKVGRNGSFVDNGGAGGILAGIDVDSGVIATHGYDEFGTEYITHPDSGVPFKGYSFTKWEEMKEMCCEMASMIPSVKCIGWDVTLTDHGWIVVEGNGSTQFIGPQIVFKKGIKKEVIDILKRTDLITNKKISL